VEEGITICPHCGADLKLPGAFLQVFGWVVFFVSWIPLVVGAIAMKQNNYVPLGIGIAVAVAGIIMIVTGRTKSRGVPSPTRPTPGATGTPKR
jgi:hypothetical protein